MKIIGIYGIQDIKLCDYPEFIHDHNLAVFEGGKCIHYVHLERFTGRKYDNRMPQYLYQLLRELGLASEEDVEVVFVDHFIGRSFISFQGDIRFEALPSSTLQKNAESGTMRWYGKQKTAFAVNHELAHIYSCLPFFGMFKENSLLVHFDGGASRGNFSVWHWKNNSLNLLESSWRLKYLSSLFNANALTFYLVGGNRKNQNAVPGKFMGLAAYGEYAEELEYWLEENAYFEDIWAKKQKFYKAVKAQWDISLYEIDNRNSFLHDVAATFQHVFERDFLDVLASYQQSTQTDYLYYSGGSALNIPLNTKIIQSGLFKDVFIPPCANDSGLAIGAAALRQLQYVNSINKHLPYLNTLETMQEVNFSPDEIRKTAECIVNGGIVGICNGPGEAGPRALGNRSILCRADDPSLARKVSMQMKGREWYRPLAPIMLERNAKYFTGLNHIHHLSRYMLLEFFIPVKHRDELSGAVHVNNTSRIQTIYQEPENPFMYALLEYLESAFNIRALINTSFNLQGKPMVQTTPEAMKAAKSMDLDALVINGSYTETF